MSGQNESPENFGFKHLQTVYKGDTVDILIKSKKGEELKKKPLFLFCQGSLPIPPLKATGEKNYDIFNWDKVADDWRSWLKACDSRLPVETFSGKN